MAHVKTPQETQFLDAFQRDDPVEAGILAKAKGYPRSTANTCAEHLKARCLEAILLEHPFISAGEHSIQKLSLSVAFTHLPSSPAATRAALDCLEAIFRAGGHAQPELIGLCVDAKVPTEVFAFLLARCPAPQLALRESFLLAEAATHDLAGHAKALLKAGVDPYETCPTFEIAPAHIAARLGSWDTLDALMEAGCRINEQEAWRIEHDVAHGQEIEPLRDLMRKFAIVDERSELARATEDAAASKARPRL